METHTEAQPAAPQAEQKMVFAETDRIVIGTPCYGGNVKQEYLTSYVATLLHITVPVRIEGSNAPTYMPIIAEGMFLDKESHIDRARNKVANRFLLTPYQWLLMVDSDIVWPIEAVARLWQHGMSGHKIVCAPYALKGILPQFAINAVKGTRPNELGLVDAMHGGTGFMLIHRSVFEAMAAGGLAPEYSLGSNDPDLHTLKTSRAYFKSGVRRVPEADKTLWLSEDYMFCHEWRSLGGHVMIDTKIVLEHIGDCKYPVDPAQTFMAAREFRRINHPACPVELV